MIRRFTILDHLSQNAMTNPLGLNEFLKEIDEPPPKEPPSSVASSSAQRPTLARRRPRSTGHPLHRPIAQVDDDDDEDDMDQDELYHRILQHPDLSQLDTTTVEIADGKHHIHDGDQEIIVSTPVSAYCLSRPSTPARAIQVPVDAVKSTMARGSQGQPSTAKDRSARHQLSQDVVDVLRRHKEVQMKRSTIMTHSVVQRQLKAMWHVVVKSAQGGVVVDEAAGISMEDYLAFYSTLLGGLTFGWDDHMGASILQRAWECDRRGLDALDVDCFCMSLFFFVEKWVDDTTLPEYKRVLKLLRDIYLGKAPTSGSNLAKPTLHKYNQQLEQEAEHQALNIVLGKSVDFDAVAYLHYNNAVDMLSASPVTHRRHSTVVLDGSSASTTRAIQSSMQIQITVKDKPRPATGGAIRQKDNPPPLVTSTSSSSLGESTKRDITPPPKLAMAATASVPLLPVCRDRLPGGGAYKPFGKKGSYRKLLPQL
ncbi:Aste57867_3993 [Aphanomyces stellatus]|uniref:Aste57867_3993 protein n=1 Tax=Aphanomyces stellatus TaxID=120398 RepID=A0A485KCD4_9STRA|nr:hypothetical protein As57867_003982 [Aphanomyces stellatus]VFT81128.1 Aste57867_3993 [Aphanomyces stellatus]